MKAIIWKDGSVTYMNNKGEIVTTPKQKQKL